MVRTARPNAARPPGEPMSSSPMASRVAARSHQMATNGSSLSQKPHQKLRFDGLDWRGRGGARANNVHHATSATVTR